MSEESKLQTVQKITGQLLAARERLKTVAPEYLWSIINPILRDYGQCYGSQTHSLVPHRMGQNPGYDAKTEDGGTVEIRVRIKNAAHRFRVPVPNQIGTIRSRMLTLPRKVTFKGTADFLLFLEIKDDGTCEEIYFGSSSQILSISTEERGRRSVSVEDLRVQGQQSQSFE